MFDCKDMWTRLVHILALRWWFIMNKIISLKTKINIIKTKTC